MLIMYMYLLKNMHLKINGTIDMHSVCNTVILVYNEYFFKKLFILYFLYRIAKIFCGPKFSQINFTFYSNVTKIKFTKIDLIQFN